MEIQIAVESVILWNYEPQLGPEYGASLKVVLTGGLTRGAGQSYSYEYVLSRVPVVPDATAEGYYRFCAVEYYDPTQGCFVSIPETWSDWYYLNDGISYINGQRHDRQGN